MAKLVGTRNSIYIYQVEQDFFFSLILSLLNDHSSMVGQSGYMIFYEARVSGTHTNPVPPLIPSSAKIEKCCLPKHQFIISNVGWINSNPIYPLAKVAASIFAQWLCSWLRKRNMYYNANYLYLRKMVFCCS